MKTLASALLLLGLSAAIRAQPSDPCPRDLASATIEQRIQDLARFELEEIQKPGQPSSVRVGLREDLEEKLRSLSEHSGISAADLRARVLGAKKNRFFMTKSRALPDALRRELERFPDRYDHRPDELKNGGVIHAVAVSPDGRWMVAGSDRGKVSFWILDTVKKIERVLPNTGPVQSLAISSDGNKVASVAKNGLAIIRNSASFLMLRELPIDGLENSIAFSPDGETLAVASDSGSVSLWDLRAPMGAEPFLLAESEGVFRSAVFHPNGRLAVVGPKGVVLWNGLAQETLPRSNDDEAFSTVFSPDGKTLAIGTRTGAIELWDLETSTELKRWRAQRCAVCSLAFSPDGTRIASADGLSAVVSYLDRDLPPEWIGRGGLGDVNAVAFTPDGRRLITAGSWLMVWKRTPRAEFTELVP